MCSLEDRSAQPRSLHWCGWSRHDMWKQLRPSQERDGPELQELESQPCCGWGEAEQ